MPMLLGPPTRMLASIFRIEIWGGGWLFDFRTGGARIHNYWPIRPFWESPKTNSGPARALRWAGVTGALYGYGLAIAIGGRQAH